MKVALHINVCKHGHGVVTNIWTSQLGCPFQKFLCYHRESSEDYPTKLCPALSFRVLLLLHPFVVHNGIYLN